MTKREILSRIDRLHDDLAQLPAIPFQLEDLNKGIGRIMDQVADLRVELDLELLA